ncbi:MAG: penicillin-binding protein 2 [Chromatiales bacterium]|nr:penicillin-binding protein 2 [Chromatiales bacterium]
MAARQTPYYRSFNRRSALVGGLLLLAGAALVARAVHLQVLNTDFLNEQAAARHLRVATISAARGPITDRHGEPLAVSTPVDSVWVNPRQLVDQPQQVALLARALQMDADGLGARLARNANREFLYLRRHMHPADAAAVQALRIPGVHLMREYRRFYPAGEVTGHLLGFTNIDDVGQEGLELAFDNWLRGEPGRNRVLRDRMGRIIGQVESIALPRPGGELATSLDLRIQYLAYRELKETVQRHRAAAGSVVVLDIQTGEVLALVNQPAFNPNDRGQLDPDRYRNRAITDIIEPGSTLKPVLVAAALESGQYTPESYVDTGPGFLMVGNRRIEDRQRLGRMDLATLLARSSNVGATMIALSLDPEYFHDSLRRFGVGRLTASGFPGESAGLLPHHRNWRQINQATLGYGYGLATTPLQLAQAYAVLGSGGLHRPVSLLKVERPPIARRVVTPESAAAVLEMMEVVVSPQGTGIRAAVAGYRVAGKTGTARKLTPTGYADDRHTAIFGGLAPVSDPRLAIVVVIDEPRAGQFFGSEVAAPLFSSIAAGALRLLAVPPDALPGSGTAGNTVIAQSP